MPGPELVRAIRPCARCPLVVPLPGLREAPFPLKRKENMSFLKASTSFTRFRIIDDVPAELWPAIPEKLRQFAFMGHRRHRRGTGLRLDQFRRHARYRMEAQPSGKGRLSDLFPPARHAPHSARRATQAHAHRAARGGRPASRNWARSSFPRDRKKEIGEQVKLRLMGRFLPIPAEFQVVWNTRTGRVYFASTQDEND